MSAKCFIGPRGEEDNDQGSSRHQQEECVNTFGHSALKEKEKNTAVMSLYLIRIRVYPHLTLFALHAYQAGSRTCLKCSLTWIRMTVLRLNLCVRTISDP